MEILDAGKLCSGEKFFIIAGPCVIESEEICMYAAGKLKSACGRAGFPFIFKSSYSKANRSSHDSYSGPGIKKGLKVLRKVRSEFAVPVLTDVHSAEEASVCSEYVDVLQIPAFLCRQTPLIVSAAKTGLPINVKKGQFLSPYEVVNIIKKIENEGNNKIFLTERGSTFGYNNLVVDMRSFPIMREFGYPVVFDATHSVQLPGGKGESSGGERKFAPVLARAAAAAGCDGLFLETHPVPDEALCDGPNMLALDEFEDLLMQIKAVLKAVGKT